MKQIIAYLLIIFAFFILLIFPDIVFEGSCQGLLLWFEIVLPTLLPFLILSDLLINTPAIHLLVRITSPLFCRIFSVSKYGSFAVLCGFLCGYPMGGKVTSDLYLSGNISSNEARYLLSFCNNTSPMFIVSYVMHQNLNASHLVIPSLCILFLSPLICSFLFRHFYKITYISSSLKKTNSDVPKDNSKLMDVCIIKSFETITKIGGYIMLFSIVIQLLSSIPFERSIISHFALSFLEITNGVSVLSKNIISFRDKFIIIMSLISFGGWCSIAQTKCILAETGIPLFPYIIEKLITAIVTSLLSFIFMKLY